MVKNFLRTMLLAAVIVAAAQSSVNAEDWQDLRIENNTGITITEVYFQPASAGDWGGDFLSGTMPDGYGLDVRYISGYNYDFRFVFADGSEAVWTGDNTIYLNGHTRVNLYINDNGYYEMSWE